MKREIKFRAWDKEMNKMFMFGQDEHHDTLWARPNGEIVYYNLQNGSGGDEYELMQYTGLHDRNGKEIYEGDLLKFSDKKTSTRELWEIKDIRNLPMHPQKLEIVGNIFENPELLTN